MTSNQENFKNEFIHFALDAKVLAFGEFTTKAGRLSPYFFNAGGFNDGALLKALGEFYAKALINSGIEFDMLFGPAYKGITLAATTAIALAAMGRPVPFCFNRKEAKDHGEGGTLVGAPLKGKVVIIDDVISAGTSVRESVNIIRAAGATPSMVLIALDRMERAGTAAEIADSSAVQNVEKEFGMPVVSIANLASLMSFLQESQDPALQKYLPAVKAYRDKYGI
jgi:orotate phosphoribosyltransferase